MFFQIRLRLSLQNTAALSTPILALNLVQRLGGVSQSNREPIFGSLDSPCHMQPRERQSLIPPNVVENFVVVNDESGPVRRVPIFWKIARRVVASGIRQIIGMPKKKLRLESGLTLGGFCSTSCFGYGHEPATQLLSQLEGASTSLIGSHSV